MPKRRKDCAKLHCYEPPFLGGLCKCHHEEAEIRRRRHDEAVKVLWHGIIDEKVFTSGPLRDEFHRVRDWWFRTCDAMRADREDPILKDETQFGMDWCVAITQELVDAERDLRAGGVGDTEFRQYIRRETWLRFESLEKGLMSNGVARPERRV
jgi:hypothetical protein